MRITIRCPHCQSYAVARSSRELSITLREITYQCTRPECGHTYISNLEVVRTLSPSAMPRDGVTLPISEHTKARVMQQLDLMPTTQKEAL
jgi:predicted RNA-binding Zn-ribbon protein involved in translation (DUF1610 family)